jgi:hypothetical protein
VHGRNFAWELPKVVSRVDVSRADIAGVFVKPQSALIGMEAAGWCGKRGVTRNACATKWWGPINAGPMLPQAMESQRLRYMPVNTSEWPATLSSGTYLNCMFLAFSYLAPE